MYNTDEWVAKILRDVEEKETASQDERETVDFFGTRYEESYRESRQYGEC